jgi:hypothetical protein
MRRLIPLLLCLLLPAAGMAAEKFYKWQDADGAWHYTTTPPPADRVAQEVQVDGREPAVPATAAPEAAAPATPAATDPNARSDEQINEARRASCEQARRNVQMLQNATTARMDLDRDGTPETLNAEQINAQLARARQQVQEFCNAGGG